MSNEKGLPPEMGEAINEYLCGQLAAERNMIVCPFCGVLFVPSGKYIAYSYSPNTPRWSEEEVCSESCELSFSDPEEVVYDTLNIC